METNPISTQSASFSLAQTLARTLCHPTLNGRSSRNEWAQIFFLNWLLHLAFAALTMASPVFYCVWLVYTIGMAWPIFALTIRRLHDANLSGWWIFLAGAASLLLVPFMEFPVVSLCSPLFYFFFFFVLPSKPEANRYGSAPTTMDIYL